MTAENEFTKTGYGAASGEAFEYRSIHVASVLALLLGALSSVVMFTAGVSIESTLLLVPIPVLGLGVAAYAWGQIRSAPEVYTGEKFASAGALLSALFLVYGVGYASYVNATEVPDGYTRTSFLEMKPSENDVVSRRLIPDEINKLITSGEKVFIKGYIRPDSISFTKNISDFLLVRDNQQCCFGEIDNVKYYDQIQVLLGPGLKTNFSRGLFRLGGVLKIGPPNAEAGTPFTYFLEADYVNP